ncbi:MAG: hypothetical protein IJ706_02510, partial [Clostridia bacterium]|nr:hypothetical protein [Clostridia bacterium]
WVSYANFGVETGTGWNFANVTSAKMPLFSQFSDFGKKRDFTFTFQLLAVNVTIFKNSIDKLKIKVYNGYKFVLTRQYFFQEVVYG